MGILDALTILGSGVGKGYRGSQETRRQLAEAKRRAQIEQQEQSRADRLAALQEALGSSTIASQGLARDIDQFGLGEARERSSELSAPITRNKAPLGLDILGNRVNVPGTMRGLTSAQDIIGRLLGNQNDAADRIFKQKNPKLFSSGGREPTDMELAIKILTDVTGPLTQLEALNPEKAGAGLKVREDYIFQTLPLLLAKIKALRSGGGMPSDSLGDSGLSDEQAYKLYLQQKAK